VAAECGWENPSVLVSSGVSGGLTLAFLALIDPGDEVIMPDPYFVAYKNILNMLGGRCVFVDSYPDFEFPVEKISEHITDKTKLIIVNSPCNPTGAVYSGQTMRQLAGIAAERDVIILSDEIYEKFSYDQPYTSIAAHYDRAILLRGMSKSHGMTGWRLGYVAVHERLAPVIDQMTTIQQYTFVCAPTPFQKAAAAALDYDISSHIEAYRKKRDMVYEGLREKFELPRPGGAFYAFVKAPGGSATPFVEKAINNKVLVIPGNVFSEKDTHFRISYATSDAKIRQGVEILCELA
jgi:aspartate aminotransferase/aminotransferase